MLPPGATPIRSITDRPSLAPSSFTCRPVGAPCGALSQPLSRLGRRQAYHVPLVSRCGEGRASPPVVRQLRRGSSQPPDLTTYLFGPGLPRSRPTAGTTLAVLRVTASLACPL